MSKHDLKAKTLLVEQIQAFINGNPVLVASLLRYTSPITFTNPLDLVDKQYVDGLFNSFTIDGFLSGSILVSDPYDGSIETVNMNWRINNINYSDASENFTAIPLSSSGNQRYIAFYGDATNAVTKLEGSQSALAVFPETPAGKVLLGFVLVKDTEVEPPEYIPVGFAQLGTVNHFSQKNYFDNSIEVIGQILLNGVPIGDGAGGLLQFDTFDDFPLTGSANFVYLDKSEGKIYYWDVDSSDYIQIGGGSSYAFENGLREDEGTVKIGLDAPTIGTTNKGAITEDTFLARVLNDGSLIGVAFTNSETSILYSDQFIGGEKIIKVSISPDSIFISYINGALEKRLELGNFGIVFTDSEGRGAGDVQDYSATKQDYDYVTKKMLEDATGATVSFLGQTPVDGIIDLTGETIPTYPAFRVYDVTDTLKRSVPTAEYQIDGAGKFIVGLDDTRTYNVYFGGAGSGGSGGGGIQSIVAGTNITVDNTDPLNPVISSTGGGGSTTFADDTQTQTGTATNIAIDPLRLANWWTYIKGIANNISSNWSFSKGAFGTTTFGNSFITLAASTSSVASFLCTFGASYSGTMTEGLIWGEDTDKRLRIYRNAVVDEFIFAGKNKTLEGTGTAVMYIAADGSITRGAVVDEGFTLDADIISAITGATYSSNRATITPASSKIFYQGELYDDGTYTYIAIANNSVRRW